MREMSIIYLKYVHPVTIHQWHSDASLSSRLSTDCDIKIKWTQLPIIKTVNWNLTLNKSQQLMDQILHKLCCVLLLCCFKKICEHKRPSKYLWTNYKCSAHNLLIGKRMSISVCLHFHFQSLFCGSNYL